ncbi:MAG: NYN domain-containing protein [Candidatus Moranbacteria bacterium]|nr:NYN domain-containing protein [Candidatus Moranbacteria bacterium]
MNILYSFRDYASKRGIGRVIDFEKVMRECVHGRRIVKSVAYSGSNTYQGKRAFAGLNGALKLAGFELKVKQADILADRRMKCNWDVGMAIDIPKVARKMEVVILVTGDGDFIDLVIELQNEYGCEVEVVAFSDSMSLELRNVADRYSYIEDGDYLKEEPVLKKTRKMNVQKKENGAKRSVDPEIIAEGYDDDVSDLMPKLADDARDEQVTEKKSPQRKISLKRMSCFYVKKGENSGKDPGM